VNDPWLFSGQAFMDFFQFNDPSDKPLIHLAHANGFPPRTYRCFFKPFAASYRGLAFPARPLWPGSPPAKALRDWSLLADDLLSALRSLGNRKIIGVGHSLGGVLTLLAALKEPERFSRIVLIDPTMLPPPLLRKVWWMKKLGLEFRPDLVAGALRRRRHWDSLEAALESFKTKPLFRAWNPEVIEDYAKSLTAPDPQGGVSLAYSHEWEARIYQTIPTNVWKAAAQLKVPSLVIRGETSNTFTAESEAAFQKANPSAVFRVAAGAGHLVPFEKPGLTADLVLEFLNSESFGGLC
jgi:pimeloyl-ACP methyl ester carboxylesterase